MLSPTSIDYFEIILAAEASQLETNIQGIRGGGGSSVRTPHQEGARAAQAYRSYPPTVSAINTTRATILERKWRNRKINLMAFRNDRTYFSRNVIRPKSRNEIYIYKVYFEKYRNLEKVSIEGDLKGGWIERMGAGGSERGVRRRKKEKQGRLEKSG